MMHFTCYHHQSATFGLRRAPFFACENPPKKRFVVLFGRLRPVALQSQDTVLLTVQVPGLQDCKIITAITCRGNLFAQSLKLNNMKPAQGIPLLVLEFLVDGCSQLYFCLSFRSKSAEAVTFEDRNRCSQVPLQPWEMAEHETEAASSTSSPPHHHRHHLFSSSAACQEVLRREDGQGSNNLEAEARGK